MEFVRGDTMPFQFKITNLNGDSINIEEIDTMILTCRKYNIKSSPILFQKHKEDFTFEEESYHATIEPKDTENLDYGTYNYDIEVTLKDGYRKTAKGSFTITEEDTIHDSEVIMNDNI